ncbi:MAG TPA: Ku protein, partial [Baekduia sp.]
MPRSLWNGTIAFGAVAVPIKLYSAVESKTVHFHEVHVDDGARIEHRTFCSKEDKEVPREEIVKGFEVSSGRYVVVDKEEIDAAGGSRSRIIDVQHFVDAADIDPVFYDK